MAKEKVFRFKVYSVNTDENNVRPVYATREAIERIDGATIIEESVIEVDDVSVIDDNGFVRGEIM
ncbi:hypothetical protein [Pandoraea soli]